MADWTGIAGKRVLITGATNGIGLAAAKVLAGRGAKLAIVARSEAKGRDAAAQIGAAGGKDAAVDVLLADLSSQDSIRRLAVDVLERYPRLDVLINNAGALYATRGLSADGLELTWAVNHLAPFLLTTLLLERLKESAPARVIVTASDAHKGQRIPFEDIDAEHSYKGPRGFGRYGQSKLANILFTAELARRLEGSGVTANCLHPGLVASGFNRNNGPLMSVLMTVAKPFSRSVEKGAETLVWLADSPDVSAENGGYFEDLHRATPTEAAQDAQSAARLWQISDEQTRTPAASAS
jgi:NAD(P)-dependent dehydrogenase (short-subunit alcohol dehydrogenase family)